MGEIGANVGRNHANLDRRQCIVPAGRVVHAAVPGVQNRYQPRRFRITGGEEEAMPGQQSRAGLLWERGSVLALGLIADACGLPNPPGGDRVDRWLAQATRVDWLRWRCTGQPSAIPPSGIGKVGAGEDIRIEDDMWNHPGCPLRREERAQLVGRPAGIQMSEPDGDEGAIPAPLVGIEAGCGSGPGAKVVSPEDGGRGSRQIQISGHAVAIS
ncbi:MAG TPA: hypothetical protein VGR16_00815 [Thermomicrobiales bacterium]|nr:hypothetical protein [Thermomicrobiales bacterium]